ncbi:MAG TPA: nucleotide exchange factor GrpE [Thermoanaerobaculia bacterium]|nr:nucleotide exchange factor GrpE [Thermoanaerobaculia bacterium]
MVDRRDDEPPEDPGEEDVVMVEAPSETLEEILAEEEAEARRAADPAAGSGTELADARREIAELRDRELRKLAEFENFKKRTEREKSDYFRFALGDFFRDLLPVLDNFERALGHAPAAADDEYRQGIELIYRQFSDALKKRGLTEVPTTGAFDPNVHEAVAREETAGVEPNTIVAVLQKGYYLNDRLLRPAFVKVAIPPHEEKG